MQKIVATDYAAKRAQEAKLRAEDTTERGGPEEAALEALLLSLQEAGLAALKKEKP